MKLTRGENIELWIWVALGLLFTLGTLILHWNDKHYNGDMAITYAIGVLFFLDAGMVRVKATERRLSAIERAAGIK